MGQANWEAKRACPGLICVEPHYELYDWLKEVRALTVRGINLEAEGAPVQLDMFHDWEKREERKALDDAIDEIRRRFGYRSIYAASLAGDLRMAQDRCETVAMPELMYM